MILTVIAAVSLLVAVLSAAGPLFWGRRRAALPPLLPPPEPPLPSTLRHLLPSPDIVMDAPPPLAAVPLLEGQPPLAPPAVDLGLIGVREDRDAATEAIWRSVKQALAANARPS